MTTTTTTTTRWSRSEAAANGGATKAAAIDGGDGGDGGGDRRRRAAVCVRLCVCEITLYSAEATLDGDAPLGKGLKSQEEVQPLTPVRLARCLLHA